MIRSMQTNDIDRVAEIWLDTNIRAHDFISAEYWKGNLEAVRKMLPQAEVYVYEAERRDGVSGGEEYRGSSGIQGFIGLDGDYIAGIFVCHEAQSGGIGKQLLDAAKAAAVRKAAEAKTGREAAEARTGREAARPVLTLHVYQRNLRAVRFYEREGFRVRREGIDEATGEKEYSMIWEQQQ